jgi:hypothetical protein
MSGEGIVLRLPIKEVSQIDRFCGLGVPLPPVLPHNREAIASRKAKNATARVNHGEDGRGGADA